MNLLKQMSEGTDKLVNAGEEDKTDDLQAKRGATYSKILYADQYVAMYTT